MEIVAAFAIVEDKDGVIKAVVEQHCEIGMFPVMAEKEIKPIGRLAIWRVMLLPDGEARFTLASPAEHGTDG